MWETPEVFETSGVWRGLGSPLVGKSWQEMGVLVMGKVPSVGLTVTGIPVNAAVKAGDLVGITAGKMVLALASVAGQVKALGVAAASYGVGDLGAMHAMAEVDGFAGLVVGDPQYLSETVAGGVQAAAPVGIGKLKQVVGFGVFADGMMFVFQDAGVVL